MECTCEEMMEEVREELQGLERRHPYRFGHLKAELQSFINCVESQHLLLHCNNRMPSPPFSSSFSVSTQESSCGRSKKRGAREMEGIRASPSPKRSILQGTRASPSPKQSVLKGTRAGPPPERSVLKGTRAGPSPKQSRIDVVLDRAKACLYLQEGDGIGSVPLPDPPPVAVAAIRELCPHAASFSTIRAEVLFATRHCFKKLGLQRNVVLFKTLEAV